MAVVYATDLTVTRIADGTRATIEELAAIVGGWASISDPLKNSSREGRRGSTVQTELVEANDDQPRAWRLTLSHADPSDSSTTWTVSVIAIEELSNNVVVRLDRTRNGDHLRPTRDNPAPPGCIRAILDSPDLNVVDGGQPLGLDVWVPNDQDAPAVMNLVLSEDRRLPIFAFTLRDDDVIDGSVVSRALTGLAHVVLIRSSLSWLLDDLLPNGMNVYGGAARLWWPGLTDRSNRWDHPLWTAEVPALRIIRQVVESVTEAAIAHSGDDEMFIRFGRLKRDREDLAREKELLRLQGEFDRAQAIVNASGIGEGVTALAESITRLLDAERHARVSAEEDRDILDAMAFQLESELMETRKRARAAELECEYWKDHFTNLNNSSRLALDQDETLSAFRSEVENEVLSRGIVDGARPRHFIVGKRFAAKLDSMGPGNRTKIIKACADVVMNAPKLLSRRDDHSLRAGSGASDPEIIRERDGARARRCAIEQGAASARRIHYWVSSEGVVEFASVNVHDDFAIPS